MFALGAWVAVRCHWPNTWRFFTCICTDGISTGNKTASNQNRARWPALIVNVGDPIEKGDQITDFLFAEILFGHQSTMPLFIIKFGGIAHVGFKIGTAAMLGNLGEIRRIISAFAEECVAVNTVVFMPYIFSVRYFRGDGVGIRQLGKLAMTVDGEY